MNDERIDELLEDLDRELSVHPAPEVTARIRTRIAAEPRTSLLGVRWLVAAAGVCATVAAAYVNWPRSEVVSQVRDPVVSVVDRVASSDVQSSASRPPAPEPTRSTSEPVRRPAAVAFREPEVLVSPDVRLAFEQLRSDIASGRVTAASFSASRDVNITPTMITPTFVVVPGTELPESAEPAAAPAGRQSPGQDAVLASNGPLMRTRSAL